VDSLNIHFLEEFCVLLLASGLSNTADGPVIELAVLSYGLCHLLLSTRPSNGPSHPPHHLDRRLEPEHRGAGDAGENKTEELVRRGPRIQGVNGVVRALDRRQEVVGRLNEQVV